MRLRKTDHDLVNDKKFDFWTIECNDSYLKMPKEYNEYHGGFKNCHYKQSASFSETDAKKSSLFLHTM